MMEFFNQGDKEKQLGLPVSDPGSDAPLNWNRPVLVRRGDLPSRIQLHSRSWHISLTDG